MAEGSCGGCYPTCSLLFFTKSTIVPLSCVRSEAARRSSRRRAEPRRWCAPRVGWASAASRSRPTVSVPALGAPPAPATAPDAPSRPDAHACTCPLLHANPCLCPGLMGCAANARSPAPCSKPRQGALRHLLRQMQPREPGQHAGGGYKKRRSCRSGSILVVAGSHDGAASGERVAVW